MHGLFASRATMAFDLLLVGVLLAAVGHQVLFLLFALPWIGFAGHYFDLWPPRRWISSLQTLSLIAAHHLLWTAGLLVGSAQARRAVL